MVKITFTNNAGAKEEIMDETKTIREIVDAAGFTYDGASLVVNGRPVDDYEMAAPLAAMIPAGSTQVRITAVAHKQNA